MAKEKVTPMMQQFRDLKQRHPDALLLFRCGDFFETYEDDAVEASNILGITLTKRNNNKEGAAQTLMAGFPHHALDTYLPRLIRAGKRVAICEQMEDPKLTKKLVKRDITELVTPGVAMNDNVLEHSQNNFLCAVHFGKQGCGISFLDISTGEFFVAEGTPTYAAGLVGNFQPKEVLFERGKKTMFQTSFGTQLCTFELDDWVFTEQTAQKLLLSHFQVRNLKGFGVDHMHEGIVAAGAILQYLEVTHHPNTRHITQLQRIEENNFVRLDRFTLRSLELLDTITGEGTSLINVLDHTITPMGARLMRRWVAFPLKNIKQIDQRLNIVTEFFRQPAMRDMLQEQLHEIGDLERIISKAAVGRIGPRDMVQLRIALQALEPIREACLQSEDDTLRMMAEQLNLCTDMRDRIEREVEPSPPLLLNKGGVIRSGVNAELDELRNIAFHGKEYLLQIQQREIELTGINSLKIGYNNVFGYYLEVRNTYKDQVPPEWIRKQTLTGAERYITQELKEYEEKIMGAEDKILVLEAKIYQDLVQALAEYIAPIQLNAQLLAQIDVLLSFSTTARMNNYVRPVVDESMVLDIRQGRHPVIEQQLPAGERYVPNDVWLDTDKQQIIIITGPNMAGKSALLRQTALITLMAQIGCYVPAQSAHIGVVDKIFTRVGASDNISMGESTFMVEMTEAANILNNISQRSLVLFDELGRGTSTYDGISIAWAIVEYLHQNPRAHARTLFATHYHELNDMEQHFPRIHNFNVSVVESNGRIVFMRTLKPGGSAHSYGIHVARLAGMPREIVNRADQVLKQLEQEKEGEVTVPVAAPSASNGMQMNFFKLDDPVLAQVRDEILDLDVNNLTPLQALNKLSDIKRIVNGK
ncbi:MAG: DNA mismatch repair protein MutS [Bacteroidaceae bacterium]|nr:DNA mismatch repair protein MutS [Bacteroidaceae bacterium]